MKIKTPEIMRLYVHKTDGGAEYLCSSPVPGTQEGNFASKYIVRKYGKNFYELLINK